MSIRTMTMAAGALCVAAIALNAETDINLDLFLQPWSRLDQNNAFYADGHFQIGLHRAETALRAEKKIGPFDAAGKLRIDMAENTVQEALQNAWVALTFKPYLKFKAGKFKIPFGANNLIAPSRLPTVFNSFTVDNLKYELGVAGFRSGAMVYGDINPAVHFAFGTFEYPLHDLPGTGERDLFRQPVARVGWQPGPMVGFDYMVTAPELARVRSNGTVISRRLLLHDIAVTVDYSRWYRGSLEWFIGVDTADAPLVQLIYGGYQSNVAYSLYTAHTVTVPLPRKRMLRLTTAGEFLNGLDYRYEQYVLRAFYYALTQDVQLHLGSGVVMELSYDMRLDERLHGFKYQRVAAQIHFGTTGRIKTARKPARTGRDELED
ncbi:MAG: hypothetical protein JXA71_20010 [Chitinispirillaceae bacterium]|nr:hypothetical protein [Chitinispirillaceae bacterium]